MTLELLCVHTQRQTSQGTLPAQEILAGQNPQHNLFMVATNPYFPFVVLKIQNNFSHNKAQMFHLLSNIIIQFLTVANL